MIRVVVADDDVDVLQSTCDLLEILGFEAVPARRAADVLKTLRESPPHILLQDVNMPGLDLQELMAAIRADPATRRLPVYIFTASVDADEVVRRVGADGAVRKPFDAGQLKTIIERAVQPA